MHMHDTEMEANLSRGAKERERDERENSGGGIYPVSIIDLCGNKCM